MKPIFFSIACFLATTVASFAQDSQPVAPTRNFTGGSEVIIGHGFLPTQQVFNGGAYGFRYTNDRYTGALSATYRYHISKLISLGVAVAFENEQGTWRSNYFNWRSNPDLIVPLSAPYRGNFNRSAFTFAPEITFNYCDFGHGLVRLYSVVGLGYTFCNERITYDNTPTAQHFAPNEKPIQFNAYGSPIGIRAGKQLSGFFELGFGYKGVFNYGLTYRF